MKVRALCDTYINSCYRVEGQVFHYDGPPNKNVVAVPDSTVNVEPPRFALNDINVRQALPIATATAPQTAYPATDPVAAALAVLAAAGYNVQAPAAPPAPPAVPEAVMASVRAAALGEPAPQAAVPAVASVRLPASVQAEDGADLLGGLSLPAVASVRLPASVQAEDGADLLGGLSLP